MFTAWQPKDEDPLILVAVRNACLSAAYRKIGERDPACRPGMTKLANEKHRLATDALETFVRGCGEMTQSHLPTPSGPEGGLWDR